MDLQSLKSSLDLNGHTGQQIMTYGKGKKKLYFLGKNRGQVFFQHIRHKSIRQNL